LPFTHLHLYGNHWDEAADIIERTLRQRMPGPDGEPDREFEEAEISDAERRAAMARERMRRLGVR
jgi:hypothetical protein